MIKFKLCLSFLCFLSLSCFSQVGINTDTPDATLDVNGNVKLRVINTTTGNTNSISPLVMDDVTKEIKVIRSSSGNTFSINYLVYHLRNVNKDWVSDFNTKISTSDYTLVVVGSSFDKNLKLPLTVDCDYSPINVYAFQSGGTWHINADYMDSTTERGENGTWKVYCLAINNSILKRLPSVSKNMNGSQNGSAASPPAGL